MTTFSKPKKIKFGITLLVGFLLITSCGSPPNQDNSTPDVNYIPLDHGETDIIVKESIPELGEVFTHLAFQLGDGKPLPLEIEASTVQVGEPLSDEEILEILSRIPELSPEPGDLASFRLPEELLPPPITGEIIEETFPILGSDLPPDAVEYGPLEVLRYSPEGEISIAPFINLTFNQPMVAVDSLQGLAAENVPVTLEPSVQGTWRWLGTKTINFQYNPDLIDRLPMATEYTVSVPEGTESIVGNRLVQPFQFSFQTPAPTIQSVHPTGQAQPLDSVFFISFDQRIDPEKVLKTVQVSADQENVGIRLATKDEIETDKGVLSLSENTMAGRWLAFTTLSDLPADTPILVTIGPGTPSAEGPLTTRDAQSFSFQTYAPFKIVDHGCQWWEDVCRPLVPLYNEFNNPIDETQYDETMLRIDPEVPGVSLDIFGNMIQIRGATKGNTTYKVTVSGDIQDIFGQKIGHDQTLKFKIGSAEPVLIGPGKILVTLDPASERPGLSLYTINYNKIELEIYSVEPSDWPAFQAYLREYQQSNSPIKPPGKVIFQETHRVEASTDTLTEIVIDFSEHMEDKSGHFILIAKPPKELFKEERYWETVQTWIQITNIGLDAFVDHSEMIVWTNALTDGKPLNNITIFSNTGKELGKTGSEGTLRFELTSDGLPFIIARNDHESSFLPPSISYWGDEGWQKREVNDQVRWYVYDDRQMYRPGEDINIKGWLRQIGAKQGGDVTLIDTALDSIQFQVFDPLRNVLGEGKIDGNSLGGFSLQFTLPENANLGPAYVEFSAIGSFANLDGLWYTHRFEIQEFRRPEFEVTARNETAGPYFQGDTAIVAVEAKYYAGGALPNAEVNWWVTSSPGTYSPPNWPDFSFGVWQPWWRYSYDDNGESFSENYAGTTDATGNHYLEIKLTNVDVARPFSILADATVMDVNRQAWVDTTSLLVHPANIYVGLKTDRYFVQQGLPISVDLIVVNLDGEPVEDRPILVTAARLEWKYRNGTWNEQETDIQECSVGSKLDPVSCSFDTPMGGRYRIKARITDNEGRQNESSITRWVSGGQQPPSREVEKEDVTLIPDQEEYQPGDTAEILVQAPFSPAEGLLTVSRNGILYSERFQIREYSKVLQIPIQAEHIPNLNIQVDLVGSAPRMDDQGEAIPEAALRPAYASGTITLNVPPYQRTLSLDIKPRDGQLEPGGETTLEVILRDADGKPIPDAELSVVVVDEAILALTNYQMVDPISVFYATRPSNLNSYYSRANIILADPQAFTEAVEDAKQVSEQRMVEKEVMAESLAMEAPAPEADAEGFAGSSQISAAPIRIRSDFNPLAVFSPEVRTNPQGQARIEVKLPDNLTRYRIMVVAVDSDGNRFGMGEESLTARLPLMVRPSPPRFLNFGDKIELPVVLQNQTNEDMIVSIVLQTTNLLLTGERGLEVQIPANDRVEVRFPAAAQEAGNARFQVTAVAGQYADAASGIFPVYTPATTEAFATYGVVDEGSIVQPIGSPNEVFSQFGGLEIQTSSTALQALTDAVIYLVSYPFECSEQLASRILGVAALKDVLAAFNAEGLPSPEEMEAAVKRDIQRLQGLQNWDGGVPYWRRGQESIPFNTIHVAHALQEAKSKGFEIPAELQEGLLLYLQEIEDYYPYWYSQRTRQTLSAYALYVRDLMGDPDPAKTRQLLSDSGLENLSMDAVGWIWSALVNEPNSTTELDSIRRFISNRVVETAGAANFTTKYDDQIYLLLSSNRRTDAILLTSLMADDPENDLIPKLVNGLLAHRTNGRWNNTQENVFVLLALDQYFNTFESQTPDFVAQIWLGQTYAGEHAYTGRTTERHETQIPMVYLVDTEYGGGDLQNLVISKDGKGRLYYRIGLKYAPTDLWLDPLDMGFVIERTYESVDDPEDIFKDSDGIWHFKAGARIRVRLTMVADNRRYHVALVDPLPAGLEIVNPALAVSGSLPQDPDSPEYKSGWWYWPWYQHQNMRDERAEAFSTLLWDGVYEYSYITRATTPGTFVVPPAKAEEMYSPEVFGRSASDMVVIE